jgi:hypothetical protein
MDHLFDILFDVGDWSDFTQVEHHSDLNPTARVRISVGNFAGVNL